jgi:TRAP-type C4-dicarboxylate transport system permease small subunit
MRRFLDRLYLGAGIAAAAALAAIFIIMMAQSFGREAGFVLSGADDIVAWLCAACAFLALGHTFRAGDLVRVGVFLDHLGPRPRWIAEIFSLGFTAIFTAYMLWAVSRFVYLSWEFKEVAQGMIKAPIWIPQMSLVIGMAIFFIAVLDDLILVCKKQKPAYQAAEEARAASGDFSEKL